MRTIEIEAWTMRVVEVVRRGDKVEDAAVELKSDWPDPAASARRIAGLANAAGGAPTLWVVGLDETRGVVARSNSDPAQWWSQVAAQFDEEVPKMTDLVVHAPGGTVVALCFYTDRAPYVVKNPDGGKVQREVPWREGTSLRTAKRSDLVRLLVPLQNAPRLSVVSAQLYFMPHRQDGREVEGSDLDWQLRARLYFTAGQGSYAVFPLRLQRVVLEPARGGVQWPSSAVRLDAKASVRLGGFIPGVEKGVDMRVQTIHNGVEQLIVEGHGYAWLTADGVVRGVNGVRPLVHLADAVRATVSLTGVELSAPVVASVELVQGDATQAKWGPSLIAYWRAVDEQEGN